MLDKDRRSPPRTGGAAAAAVVAGVGFLTLLVLVAVAWAPLLALDHAVVAAANAVVAHRPGVVAVIRGVTDAGNPVTVDVITAVAAVAMLVDRRYRAAIYLVVVRGLELVVETAVKDLLDRPRPATDVVVATASGAAFPSGHTAGTAAVVVSLLLLAHPVLARRWRIVVAGFSIVAVGASRVLLGVHYPSDVVAGAFLGVACAAGLAVVLRPGYPRPVAAGVSRR